MKKRIASILLAALLILTALPFASPVLAESNEGWAKLRAAMYGQTTTDYGSYFELEELPDSVRKITLLSDIVAGSDDMFLEVLTGGKIILDLNGCSVDRGLSGLEAVENGYVIKVRGLLTVTDGSLKKTGRITGGNNTGNGGGLLVNQGTVELTGVTLFDNMTAKNGGAVFAYNNADVTLTDCRILQNTALNYGGGVYATESALQMSNCLVKGNHAELQGGGLFIDTCTDTELNGCTVKENTAAVSAGGIRFTSCTAVLNDCEIAKNISLLNGGGMIIAGIGNVTVNNTEITKNQAANTGAGVYVMYHADGKNYFTMIGGSINGNDALGTAKDSEDRKIGISGGSAGAVFVDDDTKVTLIDVMIRDNTAVNMGGGICANSPFTVGGSTKIIKNTVNGKTDNVYLRNIAKARTVERPFGDPTVIISTEYDLTSGARIGVTLESGVGTFVKEAARDYTRSFFSDSDYELVVFEGGAMNLIENPDVCVCADIVKLSRGTLGMRLDGMDVGEFTFAKVGSQWSIRNGDRKYLAANNGFLVFSDDPFLWTYKSGAFYYTEELAANDAYKPGKAGIKGRVFYLSTVKEGEPLSRCFVGVSFYKKHTAPAHNFGKYVDCTDGVHHMRICKCCGTVRMTEHRFGSNHKCMDCGAYDPAAAFIRVSVQRDKHVVHLLFFKFTLYTATIKTHAFGTRVARVEYSLDGGIHYLPGSILVSDRPIESFLIRVRDTAGIVREYVCVGKYVFEK